MTVVYTDLVKIIFFYSKDGNYGVLPKFSEIANCCMNNKEKSEQKFVSLSLVKAPACDFQKYFCVTTSVSTVHIGCIYTYKYTNSELLL